MDKSGGLLLSADALNGYPRGTAVILCRENNAVYEWAISADPDVDNETTLRDHLRKHHPGAKMIGWAIK